MPRAGIRGSTATSRDRLLGRGARWLPAALVTGTGVAAARALRPPRPRGAAAPEHVFSARRAERYLEVVAAVPRPIGSAAAEGVRALLAEHLSRLGMEVQTQDAFTAVDLGPVPYGPPYRAAGRVRNIVGRLAGATPGQAVLLMTHYDSVAQGPGASDAGMLVAAVLETVRALRARPLLRNDLIVVFTDGEEAGMLGARAFFDEHPWAASVRAVLNFEARGTRGPVLMFETGPASGGLIARLGQLRHVPVTSSLFETVYRHLPNMTDFGVARERALPGLNFAHIGGFIHYHGPSDDIEHVDRGSLQHHGELMLGMVSRLGGDDLTTVPDKEQVFFSVGRSRLVRYPASAALPLALAGTLLAAAVMSRRPRQPGTRGDVARQVSRLLAGTGASTAMAWLLSKRSPESRHHGDFHHSAEVYLALVGLAGAITLSGGPTQVADPWQRLRVMLAPLAVASVVTSARVPGCSYLTTWPLVCGAAAELLGRTGLVPLPVAATAAGAGGAVLFTPLSRLLYDALTPRIAAVPALVLQVSGELAAPALWSLPPRTRRLLSVAGLTLAVGIIARRCLRPPGAGTPPETLSYLRDAGTGQALYVSTDPAPTDWTRRYLGPHPCRGPLPQYFPGWKRDFLHAPAVMENLCDPVADVLADEPSAAGRRHVRLRVSSPRGARQISVAVPYGCVGNWAVAGRSPASGVSAGPGEPWELWIYAPPPDGVEVDLDLPAAPAYVRVADRTDGGPGGGPWRSAAALDADAWGNGTFVMKTITI